MRMHCIIHADFEQPGYYETWAIQHGMELGFTHAHLGESLPAVEDFDCLLLMGGPQSPLELDKYPYLQNEINLIHDAIAQGKHVLGVCLGAQLIAESYGAKTERSLFREIGVFPLQLTDEVRADPIFKHFPQQFDSGHWHNDMPGIPDTAVVIARSQGCPRQIIRFSERVYGFQCHLEFNRDCVEGLINHCPDDLAEGKYVQDAKTLLAYDYDVMNDHLGLFLQHFFDDLEWLASGHENQTEAV